jgi:hypothetical protein
MLEFTVFSFRDPKKAQGVDRCARQNRVAQPTRGDRRTQATRERRPHPKIIEETQQYIRDFDRVAETTTTARGLYDKMLQLYPDRVNPGLALWLSARAAKP